MAYLSDELKEMQNNGQLPQIDFEFLGSSSFRQRERKNGSPYNAGELLLKIRSTGKECKEMVFAQLYFDKLVKTLAPGDLVRASLNLKGFVDWNKVPSGEGSLITPHNTVAADVKAERAFSSDLDERQKEQQAREMRISIAGLMQAHICAGKTNEEALKLAIEGRVLIDEYVSPLFQ